MSVLTVVRHGQASFLATNYDQLSPVGEEQARRLGRYWLEREVRFRRVYYGPAERHVRTGEIIRKMFEEAGIEWPEPVVIEDLDEFPADVITRTLLPELTRRHPNLAGWVAELKCGQDHPASRRAFDLVLREVAQRWLAEDHSVEGAGTWKEFCHRVEGAVRGILEQAPRSSHVAVFTSGGPTAATARMALGLSYENTLELTWSPRNCSFAEFLFTPGRFSLSSFNCTPHLNGPGLLTYR